MHLIIEKEMLSVAKILAPLFGPVYDVLPANEEEWEAFGRPQCKTKHELHVLASKTISAMLGMGWRPQDSNTRKDAI